MHDPVNQKPAPTEGDRDEPDAAALRTAMVDAQVASRGVRSARVLDAMREVPRERFVPLPLREFAYEDTRLFVAGGQSLAPPWLIGVMCEALSLQGSEKVLEVGAGCGYSSAVLARLARSVYCVEASDQGAALAAANLADLQCHNVHVRHAEAALGWPEHAPFGAILIHLGAAEVPAALQQQLAIGGRLVMPLGPDPEVRELVRVTRMSEHLFKTEDLADVRLSASPDDMRDAPSRSGPLWARPVRVPENADATLAQAIAATATRFATPGSADLEGLLQRVGDARVVLLGESTHGTAEFYRMRDRISRELITRKGFSFIAIEGDWPDAARVDHHVRQADHPAAAWTAFARFPVWMWRNQEMRSFVEWLRTHNQLATRKVAFHGLDLYSMHNSIRAVLAYLDDVDAPAAQVARQRYGCLTPWQSDPATYGHAALTEGYKSCERAVVSMLTELLQRRPFYTGRDGERFFDALQNARLVANAERYYRTMYYGSRAAWNLRDSHMFETLEHLLAFHGPDSKAIVWAHNSHVGDSLATEMSLRGEFNIGQLCRRVFGSAAYLVGFGTHGGTVAAASNWDAPMEVKSIRPGLPGSYEALMHATGLARFLLPLRHGDPAVRQGLSAPRLERAIGVIYRPETERQSHYFEAVLPRQFDEYIWFDQTHAVTPLKTEQIEGLPDTYPFGV